jgi:V/A-type H+-transporting ATPase subunit C
MRKPMRSTGILKSLYGPMAGLVDAMFIEKQEYAYSNARVKGMSAHLLSQQQIDEMLGARSMAEMMGMLNHTGYREDFVAPAVKYGGADLVELGLGRNLSRTFAKVVKFTPARGKEAIGALLDRWDVHNIKTILLAKSVGEKNERIEPFLVMAGSLGEDKVKELLRADGVKEAIERLRGTRYYGVLEDAYPEYVNEKQAAILLAALDRFYYATLSTRIVAKGKDEMVIDGLVKSELDAKNIVNALRAKKAGMKPEQARELLFEGGNLSRGELERLAEAESVEAAVGEVVKKYDLADALKAYKEDNSLIHFEVALERRIVERGLRALRTSILSVGAIASFIFLKEEEINNIRKIVRGMEFGLAREEIRAMVVPIGG